MKRVPDTTHFASYQFLHYKVTSELAKTETNPNFKKILQKFAQHEWNDFKFWKQFSSRQVFAISPLTIIWLKILRKVLGLTFLVKYLEKQEKELISRYTDFLTKVQDEKLKIKIREAIAHETKHEEELIAQIKEERVEFISSIILGINDGLIELTGALVGFSFALQNHFFIALTGFITGIAASLSMASSAYMQAQYEPGKNAKKAAFYTGSAYFIIVLLLVLPFLITSSIILSLGLLLGVVLIVITSLSFYTSIIFERNFKHQCLQMILFTMGVATITFLIGLALRSVLGIEV